MIDAPERPSPRFPATLEPQVARQIRVRLHDHAAGANDAGISSAACGSDILFAEAMLERNARLRIYLPFEEPAFIEKSVAFADSNWPERYRAVAAAAELFIAPRDLGAALNVDPYERTNDWMLREAQRLSRGNLLFMCVWNGDQADGAGGTKHMIDAVKRAGGAVEWIDIRKL